MNTKRWSGGLGSHVCTTLEFRLRFSYGAQVALSSLGFLRPLMMISQELGAIFFFINCLQDLP